MQAHIKRNVVVILELPETDARWLMGYVQNAMYEPESTEDAESRCKLFHSLKTALTHDNYPPPPLAPIAPVSG